MMTHQQRVKAAMNFEPTNRLPTALGGGPYGIVDELYKRLLDNFSLGDPIAPFRKGHNISYMDDRILDYLNTACILFIQRFHPAAHRQRDQTLTLFLMLLGRCGNGLFPITSLLKGCSKISIPWSRLIL